MTVLGLGLAGCSEVSEVTGPTDDDLLIEKLDTCASEWNAETSDLMFLVLTDDPDVLITTNPGGECLVVFGGEATGQVPGWIYERDQNGYWDTFINSEQPDLGARYALADALYLERSEVTNAFIENPVPAGATYQHPRLRFDPQAPLPNSATLGVAPEDSGVAVDDTDYPKFIPALNNCGDIGIKPNSGYGLFDIEPTNTTCDEVVTVLMNWLEEGGYVDSSEPPEGWTCTTETQTEGMATTIYECSSDRKEMSFIGG